MALPLVYSQLISPRNANPKFKRNVNKRRRRELPPLTTEARWNRTTSVAYTKSVDNQQSNGLHTISNGSRTLTESSAKRLQKSHLKWYLRLGSNQLPLRCQRSVLPLNYAGIARAEYSTRRFVAHASTLCCLSSCTLEWYSEFLKSGEEFLLRSSLRFCCSVDVCYSSMTKSFVLASIGSICPDPDTTRGS